MTLGFLLVFGRGYGGIWDGSGAVFGEIHGRGYQESLGMGLFKRGGFPLLFGMIETLSIRGSFFCLMNMSSCHFLMR